MLPTEPLPLNHSWPLFDRSHRFDLGHMFDPLGWPARRPRQAGHWTCDLGDDTLHWSPLVYDLFGFPRGAAVARREALAIYCEDSRAIVGRLRAYAIRYRRGFTVDVTLQPGGASRRIRLVAAPECADGRAVRLRGMKIPLD